jgi:hypothetical protein
MGVENGPRGKGTFVAIVPRCPAATMNLSGSIKIFDQLGNFIYENSAPIKSGNGYYFGWDGFTSNRRIVGAGVYQAVVSIKNEDDGSTVVYSLRVGVKR